MARRMLDPDLQQRFARRCADAALGYSAAFPVQELGHWMAVAAQPGLGSPAEL